MLRFNLCKRVIVGGKYLFKPTSPSAQGYMVYYLGKNLDHSNIRPVASTTSAERQSKGMVYSVGEYKYTNVL